jgi:hypothetical protein
MKPPLRKRAEGVSLEPVVAEGVVVLIRGVVLVARDEAAKDHEPLLIC